MAKRINKKKTPMEKLTEGYEKFIQGKEKDTKSNSREKFEEILKKATETKPRESK